MKLMDKIKNALFEEEYVEIEEKPKKKREKKPKRKIEPFEGMDDEKEVPIAKRIIPPERKTDLDKNKETIVNVKNDLVSEPVLPRYEPPLVTPVKEEKKFTMVTDDDLKPDDIVNKPKAIESKVEITSTSLYASSTYKDVSVKEVKVNNVESKPYQAGKKKDGYLDNYTVHEYGSKTKEKTYFKPSPIISPIYGIIEDTDKKEEYKPPREVRLSSSFHEKVNLDDVRNKAFGGLVEDISKFDDNVLEETKGVTIDDDNLLVDLRDDKSVVEVDKVTVGDAVEYFEDLGLEYNNDYIDATKEKANGRRVKTDKEYDQMPVESSDDNDNDQPSFLKQKDELKNEKTDEENLFDLIDSMYDK